MSRNRTQISAVIDGTYGYPGHGPPREYCQTITSRHTIQDNPPGMWNDFIVDKAESTNPCISCTTLDGWNEELHNWAPLGFRDPMENNPMPQAYDSPTNGAAATKLLKMTNPSRPQISIPNFLWELREIPNLLKNEGNTLIQRAGSLNLNIQFGWLPTIGDLEKLIGFQGHVEDRLKELRELRKSGLRRKRVLYQGSATEESWVSLNSWLLGLSAQYTSIGTEKVWGYVEWFLEKGHSMPTSDDAMRTLARNAVLGLRLDLSTAWEAIPWSWLIDWCSNVGDYLIANRNTAGISHGPCYIMRTRTGETKYKAHATYGNSLIPGGYPEVTRRRVLKSRTISSPSLSAQLPILSLKQLSILGSIGVTRRTRGQNSN